ncbi:nitroreductase family protein [Thermosulfurimonas marina]|uniref:Nitroreductase family protein n=1 Tax=Thermosulfurimonas marina TaxID=2047767 RepID=A0A6H1WTW1_9BACT|nr:nitroreductase [Thermosulfurimonas marina]QJA06611.1 nitroreductase family protein [Thermosulfurimonas marina]
MSGEKGRAHPVLEAIYSRRSVREYTQEVPPRELILEVLRAGIWAPSGLNNQPWRFVIVWNAEVREKLAELTRYGEIIRRAPVVIAVFLDQAVMYHQIKDHQSAGACLQNMLLAAHALGLGGVWLGEILKNADRVREVLGLPEGLELAAVVALGYPNDRRKRAGRKPLETFILKEIP